MGLNKKLITTGEAAAAADGSDHFDIATYTGNGSSYSETSFSFEPGLVWMKKRNDSFASDHFIYDSVRGNNKFLFPNLTSAEGTSTLYFTSFDSNGFTVPNNAYTNTSGKDFVAWCWKAGSSASGSGVYHTNITQRVNTTAGFSIVDFTMPVGTVPTNASYNHGLSQTPELIITKPYSGQYGSSNWYTYSSPVGTSDYLILDGTNEANFSFSLFNTVDSTKVGYRFASNVTTASNVITYNFHSVSGFSKIGSYASVSASSVSVTTGFKPRFVMIKLISGGSSAYTGWTMFDNQRDIDTDQDNPLYANSSQVEGLRGNGTGSADDSVKITFDSNGFTVDPDTNNDGETNGGTGTSYLYYAIA